MSGPLDWVAMKSKYFVTGVLAYDSTGGRIGGAAITARPTTEKRPTEADVRLSIPLPPGGEFSYTTYAGPMEYDRLGRLGRGFDDVNPYGWPGFRTIIRPVAVGVRWLLVWMHEHLHLAYGLVLDLLRHHGARCCSGRSTRRPCAPTCSSRPCSR